MREIMLNTFKDSDLSPLATTESSAQSLSEIMLTAIEDGNLDLFIIAYNEIKEKGFAFSPNELDRIMHFTTDLLKKLEESIGTVPAEDMLNDDGDDKRPFILLNVLNMLREDCFTQTLSEHEQEELERFLGRTWLEFEQYFKKLNGLDLPNTSMILNEESSKGSERSRNTISFNDPNFNEKVSSGECSDEHDLPPEDLDLYDNEENSKEAEQPPSASVKKTKIFFLAPKVGCVDNCIIM